MHVVPVPREGGDAAMAFAAHTYRGLPSKPPLVGREQELDVLRNAFEAATDGHGQLVLVSGEAGIGKTSLVQALVHEARESGALVLTGGAYDLMSTPPYGPWIDLTDRYPDDSDLPALPDVLRRGTGVGDLSGQVALFEVARDFFTEVAGVRPLVILLEDLHWADQASLDLLRYLARYVEGERILLIATYRDDEVSRRHPLFQLLPVLVRESEPERIDLRALATNEIADLITLRYSLPPVVTVELARHLSHRSEGNPLFLLEMLRSMEADGLLDGGEPRRILQDLDQSPLPPLIRQVIEGRVARLDPDTIDLLETAAVIGEIVPVDLWQEVSQSDEKPMSDAVAQAAEAHVIVESGNAATVRFTHALIREVLYQRIPVPRRRSLHRSTGDALIEGFGDDADAIAYHFEQGGDSRAWEWLIRSGLRARDTAAWLIAAERFEQAARMVENAEEYTRARGWLLFYAAFLMRYSRDPRNIEFLNESFQAATDTNDSLLRGYVHYHRGAARCMRRDIRQGLEELELGVHELEELAAERRIRATEPQSRAVIWRLLDDSDAELETVSESSATHKEQVSVFQRGVLVNWLAQSGRYTRASEMGEQYCQPVDRSGSNREFDPSWILGLAHAAAALGQVELAIDCYSRALERFREIGDYHMIEYGSWASLLMLAIPYLTDNLLERQRLVAQGNDAARRASFIDGDEFTWCSTLDDYLSGRLDLVYHASRRELETSLSAIRRESAIVSIADIHLLRGEYDRVWNYLAEILPEGADTSPGNNYFATAIQGHRIAACTLLQTGDHGAARQWLKARDHWLDWSGAQLWKAENLLLWASYFRTIGEIDEAHDYAVDALAEASEPRQPLTQVRIKRFLGEISTAQKQDEAAVRWFEESVSEAEACAAPYERALALLGLAEHRAATGSFDGVTTLIDEVRSICTPLDAQPALARVDALEAQIAARPVPAPERSDTLTERETEVLRLIARGRSNRQIADELFISTRTVERHIANIYTKIHVHNRAEATAYALRDQLV